MTPVISVENLTRTFVKKASFPFGKGERVHAVNGISFQVNREETLGIVGESGCGKTTLARMLAGLLRPTSGTVKIHGTGKDDNATGIDRMGRKELGRRVQYMFQDPVSSLNPRKTIRQAMQMPLKNLHGIVGRQAEERIEELFDAVNLGREFLNRYPHEFSGGQAQRIAIARALAANPEILVLDEPVSALDVSVQAQVLNLLEGLKARNGLTYIFITHDLAVVEAIADRIAVIYSGKIVETGPAQEIFGAPRHPYTRLLADSAPGVGRLPSIHEGGNGELPDPLNLPSGCSFAGRCSSADEICHRQKPELEEIDHECWAACFHPRSQ